MIAMKNAHRPEPRAGQTFADTLPQDSLSPVTSIQDSSFESDFGLPADRAARMAARRAFVEMKQIFMRAVVPLTDRKGQWLKQQVRQAHEPLDLWLLRGPVLAAMRHNDDDTRALRADLYRGLDLLFPDAHAAAALAEPALPDSNLPPLPMPWTLPLSGASTTHRSSPARR
jgi:hypothetical protein